MFLRLFYSLNSSYSFSIISSYVPPVPFGYSLYFLEEIDFMAYLRSSLSYISTSDRYTGVLCYYFFKSSNSISIKSSIYSSFIAKSCKNWMFLKSNISGKREWWISLSPNFLNTFINHTKDNLAILGSHYSLSI